MVPNWKVQSAVKSALKLKNFLILTFVFHFDFYINEKIESKKSTWESSFL